MKDFNIYAFGGTGTNILNKYLTEGKGRKFIDQIVGVDTSEANPVADGLFPVVRLEGAEGSGGNRKAHQPKFDDFAKQIFAKHPANKLNILVYSLAGGTGSSIGPYALRQLLQKKIPTLVICVGDIDTLNEQNNTVDTLGSMYNQTKLGVPVIFSYLENGPDVSQGEINRRACSIIDNAIKVFNLKNERVDYADVKNFFFFTDVVKADPIMSQLTFLGDADCPNYKRKPVAAISLYNDIDDIRVPFENMLYRKSGIYGEEYLGGGDTVHAVLDHGSTLTSLKEFIADRDSKTNELAGQFKNTESNPFGGGDDDGMM